MTMRILIADDHALMRDALEATIRRCWPDAEIVTARDFPSVWTALATAFDLCLCDLSMPGAGIVEGVKRTLELQPSLRLIVITGSADEDTMRRVETLNIAGFIPKFTDGAIVEEAIRLVIAGGQYLAKKSQAEIQASTLTPAQAQIVNLIRAGNTNKEIALALNISHSTVKSHVKNILERLGARNRLDACQKYVEADQPSAR